ncbi:MAG: DUF3426 domain-containing protein [Candidatus Binatia bacterium]
MTIECPACHTRYRLEDPSEITESTLFECSRDFCGHRFSLPEESLPATEASPPAEEIVEDASPPPPEWENEAVSPPPDYTPPLLQGEKSAPPIYGPQPAEPASMTLSSPPHTEEEREKPREDFEDPEESIPFSVEAPPSSPSHTFTFSSLPEEQEEMPPRKRSVSKPRSFQPTVTTVSAWPVLGFLLLLMLGYHALGKYSRAHLAETESSFAQLPLIGSSFVDNQFSTQHIALSNLQSGFWVTKDKQRVFAVSGKATNNASIPASTIQIEGQLHNSDGETVRQQKIFCGMGATADSLPTMTTNEITVLQNLIPPKQFHVPPGESVDFLLVFDNPPPTVTELSCRVADAQFRAS